MLIIRLVVLWCFRLLGTNIYDTLHKVNNAEVCLFRRKNVFRETILEMLLSPLLCAGLTNSRVVVLLLLTLCSEKKSLVYLFSHFSCVLTPSKALECRGDIKTMFKPGEQQSVSVKETVICDERQQWREIISQ